MSVVKEDKHKLETAVFQMRNEGGLQALRTLLHMRRDQINKTWMGQIGDDLIRIQGAAQEVEALIKYIDKEPTIKQLEA